MADVVINVGAVSAITAGTGLTGGTITGTGTIAAAFGTTAGTICQGNDPRITAGGGAPGLHASTHTAVGDDALTLSQSQITDLGTSLAAKVATTRQVLAGTGLGGGGALSTDVTLNVSYGSSGTTACVGNDARLSNARTPEIHASSHATGGTDVLTLGQSQISGLVTSLSNKALGATTMTAGTGLTGGGDLSANRSFAVAYGTTSTTATVGDDARFSFIAAGSATTRTLQNKLRDIVSVKDFGAVGNGVADDTVAIQAALDSGAKTVFCPNGTYKVSSTLYIPGDVAGTSVSLIGEGSNTIINADSISGSVICNYQGSWSGYKNYQYLKNLRITGIATHAVLWVGSVNGGIENVSTQGLTATNGFVFDGSFGCSFRDLTTQGATISNACFWFSRDFNCNTVDAAYTSNFCTYNFLWSKVNISSTGSAYSGSSPTGYTVGGSVFNNLCPQGGNVGLAVYDCNPGGAVFNTVYVENVALPVQFGNYATSELCRGVTMNGLFIIGYAIGSHPGGASTRALDFDNALNVTVISPEFGSFGDATVPTIIRYRDAFKCSIINYYHITGGYGSSMTTGQIKRHTSATSDAGIYVQGQETEAGSSARSHFLLMKANNYSYQHYKMTVSSSGTWVALSVIPSVL
tara:strand:+ start:4916 stop:6820 length:1905 start_codon:yes stop_codon:yes gene_type:complete